MHEPNLLICNFIHCVTAKVVLGQFGSYSGSQQKADVVKTDYSDSLLMITRMKTRMQQG